MRVWSAYWQVFGVWYGLFQAIMVTLWVASGIGLVGGLGWLVYETLP